MKNSKYIWSRKGVPHFGWDYLKSYDNETATFKCEMCGYPGVRHVNVMSHPDFEGKLKVGNECSKLMIIPSRRGIKFPTKSFFALIHNEIDGMYGLLVEGTDEFKGLRFKTRNDAIDYVAKNDLLIKID